MRLAAITFDGYAAGQTDFGALLATSPQAGLGSLMDVVRIVAGQVRAPVPNLFVSVIVAGHSDRQDRADFSCDQRRQSEADAARERAVAAWDWFKQEVNAAVAQAGGDAGEWWETSTRVTWGLVFAGAGMLLHNPPSEVERPLNRRVVFLVSVFSPEQ